MEYLNEVFSYYDKILLSLPPQYGVIISLAILLSMAYFIYNFVKGNIVWIIAIIILIPAVLPALKTIIKILLIIFQFLLLKIKI